MVSPLCTATCCTTQCVFWIFLILWPMGWNPYWDTNFCTWVWRSDTHHSIWCMYPGMTNSQLTILTTGLLWKRFPSCKYVELKYQSALKLFQHVLNLHSAAVKNDKKGKCRGKFFLEEYFNVSSKFKLHTKPVCNANVKLRVT